MSAIASVRPKGVEPEQDLVPRRAGGGRALGVRHAAAGVRLAAGRGREWRVLLVGGGIAALAIACGGGDGKEPKVQNGATLTPPTATEPAPIGTPTLEAPPTATEVAKAPVNCEVLPQEYCKGAEVVEFRTLDGNRQIMLGFKNLPAGTNISAPLAGTSEVIMFVGGGEGDWKGWGVIIDDPSGLITAVLIGDLSFDQPERRQVQEAESITAIRGSGVDNFGYSLLVSLAVKRDGICSDDNALYETLFPGITSQRPVKVIEQTPGGAISLGTLYFPEHESPPPESNC